jgi:hypothetical protein
MDLQRTPTTFIFALERLLNRPFKKVILDIPFFPVLPHRFPPLRKLVPHSMARRRRSAANAYSRSIRLKNKNKRKKHVRRTRRGGGMAKFLDARQDAVMMALMYIQLRLQLRKRWTLHLLKTIRSDRGRKLKGPLVALLLLPPMAFLLPPMALLLPPMALLVDRCRSRSLKTKNAAAFPRAVLRSTSPCAVRALQRRARLLANGQIIHTHVCIKFWARLKLGQVLNWRRDLVLCVFFRSSVRFNSSKAHSSLGSVHLILQARFGLAARLALGKKGERPALSK